MIGMVQSMSGRLKSPARIIGFLQLSANFDSDICNWSSTSAPVLGGR